MEDENEEDRRRWDEACRREAAISDLIRRHPGRLTVKAVDNLAWESGVSRATMYRLIERYRTARNVSALMGQGRGRKKGASTLRPEQERVIQQAARFAPV